MKCFLETTHTHQCKFGFINNQLETLHLNVHQLRAFVTHSPQISAFDLPALRAFLELHYFKPDLNMEYFKYACASNHTHKIFTLPTQPSLSCHLDMTQGLKLSYPQLPEPAHLCPLGHTHRFRN